MGENETDRTVTSRGAVEDAIDAAKDDKTSTWEGLARKRLKHIGRWADARERLKEKEART